ncbi:MAG TPA: SOS response-associated peptidase family protein, partial [bacterium]|nr:SOS response-associated peptidase family protein [bacterium]
IARADGQPMALAGLWETWCAPDETRELRTFTIVTATANEDVSPLHHRMPVIVEEADWSVWLGEVPGSLRDLLRAAPNGTLRSWPISTRINSPANNGAELVDPLALVGTGSV